MGTQDDEDRPEVRAKRARRMLERIAPLAVIASGIGTAVIATVAVINLIR